MKIADDLIQAARNGRLKDATRLSDELLAAKQGLNSTDEKRISVIFFVNPNDDTVVCPVPSTVTACSPAKYEPHTVDAYLSCKFTQLFDPEARCLKGACRFDD
jgi:isopenicillin N synthase-like dioxygenase